MSGAAFTHEVIRASAGSGKTHQLTSRYIGLLAGEAAPESILATTFTRKAAGEIFERVLERLSEAAGDDAKAAKLAKQIQVEGFDRDHFAALLRRVLRSLHRARVGTLDSFCLALAGNFSFEFDLPCGWSICEEADDLVLRRDALERLLDQHPQDVISLYDLLSRGDSSRPVQSQLVEVIDKHYEIFRESEQAAWTGLAVPAAVPGARLRDALANVRARDLTACDKRFAPARDSDLERFEAEEWTEFLGKGLASKIHGGERKYYRKDIPEALCRQYQPLIEHARERIVRRIADQTRATWDLLQRFHQELWSLRRQSGRLRFGDVTFAIVNGIAAGALSDDALAFRLDGAIDHLLLDEFQDTSLAQWHVLFPIARAITRTRSGGRRSFLGVGDVKQAIYGWRGGMAEIFNTLNKSLGSLTERPLTESRRSAQPIIDVVNKVFGGLTRCADDDRIRPALTAWSQRFDDHTTAQKQIAGYVCVCSGPTQSDDESLPDQRARHAAHVALQVAALARRTPQRSVGVLCRSNDFAALMTFELRKHIDVSQEGGNPLTDSPAVEVILSLLALADHPGHSVALFHLKHSPVAAHLPADEGEALARQLRRELAASGHGAFVRRWAGLVAPACNRRDLLRLQQLVEVAYDYEARATLRADDFVNWVRQLSLPDPSPASVRVMTIHGAKGLQFDIVVLPELDVQLLGRPPAFVVSRDSKSLQVRSVCRYANAAERAALSAPDCAAFEEDQQRRVEEMLSLLYVAMTRPVYALHLFVPGPRRKNALTWTTLLTRTLGLDVSRGEYATLHEHGDVNWHVPFAAEAAVSAAPVEDRPLAIVLAPVQAERRRGLEHVTPSGPQRNATVAIGRLLQAADDTAAAAGTLHHAWFATIGWLEDGEPSDAVLQAAAERLRGDLPRDVWDNLDQHRAQFRAWLQAPVLRAVLSRRAYSSPEHDGFPAALAPRWRSSFAPERVERERRFCVRADDRYWNGSVDRVVWLCDGGAIVAADVLDFKTDVLAAGDRAALEQRRKYYQPQMEAYRRSIARLARLPEERVATRLVFTTASAIVPV